MSDVEIIGEHDAMQSAADRLTAADARGEVAFMEVPIIQAETEASESVN